MRGIYLREKKEVMIVDLDLAQSGRIALSQIGVFLQRGPMKRGYFHHPHATAHYPSESGMTRQKVRWGEQVWDRERQAPDVDVRHLYDSGGRDGDDDDDDDDEACQRARQCVDHRSTPARSPVPHNHRPTWLRRATQSQAPPPDVRVRQQRTCRDCRDSLGRSTSGTLQQECPSA